MLYFIDDQAKWLLTEPQLRAYLSEHGIANPPPAIPVAGRWRGKNLYSANVA
jgi:hypothetical protein